MQIHVTDFTGETGEQPMQKVANVVMTMQRVLNTIGFGLGNIVHKIIINKFAQIYILRIDTFSSPNHIAII